MLARTSYVSRCGDFTVKQLRLSLVNETDINPLKRLDYYRTFLPDSGFCTYAMLIAMVILR